MDVESQCLCDVLQRSRRREQEGRKADAEWMPASEDDDRNRDEATAGDIPSTKVPACDNTRTPPANPPSAPAASVARTRMRVTGTPAVSAAVGFSPIARRASPACVYSRNHHVPESGRMRRR